MQKMHERIFQIDRFVPFAAESVPVKNGLTIFFPILTKKCLVVCGNLYTFAVVE